MAPSSWKHPDVIRQVAQRLRTLRERRGLTQEELAERADLRVETVNRTQNARSNPGLDTLASLASALDVGLADLVDPARPLPLPMLSPAEEELLGMWRDLPRHTRKHVLAILQELTERDAVPLAAEPPVTAEPSMDVARAWGRLAEEEREALWRLLISLAR